MEKKNFEESETKNNNNNNTMNMSSAYWVFEELESALKQQPGKLWLELLRGAKTPTFKVFFHDEPLRIRIPIDEKDVRASWTTSGQSMANAGKDYYKVVVQEPEMNCASRKRFCSCFELLENLLTRSTMHAILSNYPENFKDPKTKKTFMREFAIHEFHPFLWGDNKNLFSAFVSQKTVHGDKLANLKGRKSAVDMVIEIASVRYTDTGAWPTINVVSVEDVKTVKYVPSGSSAGAKPLLPGKFALEPECVPGPENDEEAEYIEDDEEEMSE